MGGIMLLHVGTTLCVCVCPAPLGTSFQRIITDSSALEASAVHQLIFCAGKVYYELAAQRAKAGLEGQVAITRLEQISPFPYDLVSRELQRFPSAEVVWVQEEPKNMGAWSYVQPRLLTSARDSRRIR